jgi:heme exporter protein D
MVNWFFWLAMGITLIFFILVMILFVLQCTIYSRVEKTWLHYDKQHYAKGDDD